MVFVRPVTLHEGCKLQNIIRRSNDTVKLRRAQIILASAQGISVPEIAKMYHCSEEHIRILVKRFNGEGLDSLPRKKGGGRPPVITEEEKSMIVELALMAPEIAGCPFTTWSLRKLAQVAEERKVVKEISAERLRQILQEAKISYQRTKTWKESDDPDYEYKKTNKRALSKCTGRWWGHMLW